MMIQMEWTAWMNLNVSNKCVSACGNVQEACTKGEVCSKRGNYNNRNAERMEMEMEMAFSWPLFCHLPRRILTQRPFSSLHWKTTFDLLETTKMTLGPDQINRYDQYLRNRTVQNHCQPIHSSQALTSATIKLGSPSN